MSISPVLNGNLISPTSDRLLTIIPTIFCYQTTWQPLKNLIVTLGNQYEQENNCLATTTTKKNTIAMP